MWEGKITQELVDLHGKYLDKYGAEPDEYDQIIYNGMSYDEYITYIRLCLEKNLEMPDIVK